MFNAISPIQLNMDYSPGRKMLFDSGYDLRQSTYYAPDGTNLSKSPILRSLFQKAIGDQKLIVKLDKLAANAGMQESIAEMEYDRDNGLRHVEPKNYAHNKKIKVLFDRAKKIAWAKVKSDPRAQELIKKERQIEIDNIKANRRSTQTILNIRK
tara:strand:- start:64 stop:525 length:462 start_codon:yes stop_codon:yes gene_type:complete